MYPCKFSYFNLKWEKTKEKEVESFLRELVNWACGDRILLFLQDIYVGSPEMCQRFLQFGTSSANPPRLAGSPVSSCCRLSVSSEQIFLLSCKAVGFLAVIVTSGSSWG